MKTCDPTGIAAQTTADDVDGWDSLAHARFIMKIEEVFKFRFPGDRLFDLDCVGDRVTLVEECTHVGSADPVSPPHLKARQRGVLNAH